jgi:hypothetical protein
MPLVMFVSVVMIKTAVEGTSPRFFVDRAGVFAKFVLHATVLAAKALVSNVAQRDLGKNVIVHRGLQLLLFCATNVAIEVAERELATITM